MRLLRVLFGVVLFLGISSLAIDAFLKNYEVQKLKQAYAREAISALAMDAALTFPSASSETFQVNFWSRDETPCIFFTNQIEVSGNRSTVKWDDWPSGLVPSCTDFFSSYTKAPQDWSTTLPMNCLPVVVSGNKRGPELSFVVAAANGSETTALSQGYLSFQQIERLKNIKTSYPQFYYTPRFILGGGLEGVFIEPIEVSECEGFDLFRFQTSVEDPKLMLPDLEAAGYYVGMN